MTVPQALATSTYNARLRDGNSVPFPTVRGSVEAKNRNAVARSKPRRARRLNHEIMTTPQAVTYLLGAAIDSAATRIPDSSGCMANLC